MRNCHYWGRYGRSWREVHGGRVVGVRAGRVAGFRAADALRTALGVRPYSVPAPAHPGQPARGGMPWAGPGVPTPSLSGPTTPSAHGSFGRATGPDMRDSVTGGIDGGAAPAGAPHLPLKPGGRRRGVLTAATGAALAGAAVVAAVLLLPGSGKPPQISGGSPGGQATGQANSPKAAVSATGAPAESTAVTGQPVAFTDPGSVPAVAAVFRADGRSAGSRSNPEVRQILTEADGR
jgi:hypothetical protein